MSTVARMREEFAVSIRRQKKQQIFKSYRRKLRNEMIQEEQNKMMQILSCPQVKQEWIYSKARDLTGIPDQSWRYVIIDLFASLTCFKGREAFKFWISTSIIKNLCLLFLQDYRYLGLASQAAKLLGNIIYLQDEQQDVKTSQVAKEIFEQQVLRDLILYSEDTTLSHEEISHLMTLICNLALFDLGPVVKNGGFTTFIEWSLRILRQKKLNRAYLDQIYGFFLFFASKLKEIPTNLNCSIKLLNLVNEFSQLDQTVFLLTNMLQIVSNILTNSPKDSMYRNLFYLRQLTARIFELSTHENEHIRFEAWKILSLASSATFDVVSVFQQNNYMNAIMIAYEYEPKDSSNFDKITSNILTCVSNLFCDGDMVREMIINSPIISIIIDSTHPDRTTNVRKDAYYCLCTLLSTENYNMLNKIVYETIIMQKLVFGLQTMLDKDRNAVKDIIYTLFLVIKLDQKVFKNHGNGILEMLEAKYCFSNVLNQVLEKYHKQAHFSETINAIFDLYSC